MTTATERVIDRGDYVEIRIADLAEEVVAAIKAEMEAAGWVEVVR